MIKNFIENIIKQLRAIWIALFWSDQKKTESLLKKSLEVLQDLCAKLFVSKKKDTFVCFDIPKSKYMAVIKVTKNYSDKKKWRVMVGVTEEGTDKILEVYMAKPMDNAEVIDYLCKPETKTEILKEIIRLNEKAPDSFDF